LALTFGTLSSSQGTDASFGPVSPGPSGRFPSFLRFRLYQTLSCPIPGRSGFRFSSSSLSRFPFRRVRLYQTLFRSVSGPNSIPVAGGAAFAFRRVHYFSRFPWTLIIESTDANLGMPNSHPPGRIVGSGWLPRDAPARSRGAVPKADLPSTSLMVSDSSSARQNGPCGPTTPQ
jgi:hypothetical protein